MIPVSVIIPIGKNDQTYKVLVNELIRLNKADEFILLPTIGESIEQFDSKRISVIFCDNHRGKKLNRGSQDARNEVLWFLHSDSVIDQQHFQEIDIWHKSGHEGLAYFPLLFHDGNWPMKLTEWGVYLRSILFKIPFGDQAFVMTKKSLLELGGFPEDCNYGEDHILIWQAHLKKMPLITLPSKIGTSARKYKKSGWHKTTLRHLILTYKQASPFIFQLIKLRNP